MQKILAIATLILITATAVPAAADDDRQHDRFRLRQPQGAGIEAHFALPGECLDARPGNDGYVVGVQFANAAGAGRFVVANRLRDRGGPCIPPCDHRGEWRAPRHQRHGMHLAKHVAFQKGCCDSRQHHHGEGHKYGHGDDHRHRHSRR
jgi:hypothetical protein